MRILPGLLLCVLFPLQLVQAQRLQPSDLIYEGAFRLPDGSGTSDWSWSGQALAYFPGGDPAGLDDGYPGSLFGTGSDALQHVSEISIPVPVISPTHDVTELNAAQTLQPFRDVFGGLFGDLEIPIAGLAYLPAQGAQSAGKLHFVRGQHIQYEEATHGWMDLDLGSPNAAGPWRFGPFNNYTTADYLFEIPRPWADTHVGGRTLASGRFREGVWSGFGPSLFAAAPWQDGNPPEAGATLSSITPLLRYGIDDPASPEILTDDTMRMEGFNEDDFWTGGAWLTAGTASAVVFVGVRGLGNAWYGFSNGVVWDFECADDDSCPPFPDAPHDARGFWADSITAQMVFYDPADFAAVAAGTLQPHEPQPYAVLELDDVLIDGAGYHYARYKDWSLGATAFDRARGLLYVMEYRVEADDDKSIVHVWRVTGGSTGRTPDDTLPRDLSIDAVYPNPVVDTATIRYSISAPARVRLSVFDLLGRRLLVARDGMATAGTHESTIAVGALPAGIYFVRVDTAGGSRHRVLMRAR